MAHEPKRCFAKPINTLENINTACKSERANHNFVLCRPPLDVLCSVCVCSPASHAQDNGPLWFYNAISWYGRKYQRETAPCAALPYRGRRRCPFWRSAFMSSECVYILIWRTLYRSISFCETLYVYYYRSLTAPVHYYISGPAN
jgi:hypothetical protein